MRSRHLLREWRRSGELHEALTKRDPSGNEDVVSGATNPRSFLTRTSGDAFVASMTEAGNRTRSTATIRAAIAPTCIELAPSCGHLVELG